MNPWTEPIRPSGQPGRNHFCDRLWADSRWAFVVEMPLTVRFQGLGCFTFRRAHLPMKTSQLITPGPAARKTIWLTSYTRALVTHSPAEAEAQAEDAVQRYERRWTSDMLERSRSITQDEQAA